MANTLIDAGMKLNIIDAGENNNQYRGSNIYHINLPDNGVIKYVKFYYQIKKIISKINPQIIIAGDLYSLPSAVSFIKANIIYDSREIYTQHAGMVNKPIQQTFWSWVEKKYINKAKSVLVTAKSDVLLINKLYMDVNIFLIYNFPSIKIKIHKNYSLREKLNLSKDSKIFLYQGVLHCGRGIKTMISLLKYFPNVEAVIIGDGPYKNSLYNYSKNNNFLKRTHFIGRVKYDELLQFTKDASIGFSMIKPITQSYVNALPNKLFEYALSNVPILASNLPEMEKFINKYKIGKTVPFNDLKKQKEAITELLINKNLFINKESVKQLIWEKQENKFLQAIK